MKTHTFLVRSITLILFIGILPMVATPMVAQSDSLSTFWNPQPRNYEVTQALEVESLFPMFLYGGFHVGVGYRYCKFRIRVSIINGGNYNVDGQATGKVDEGYKRYYQTSPGIFLGYNPWKNLELYGYFETHTFKIEQLLTGEKNEIHSNDVGIGISYQFFIGRHVYIQPGVHSYFRPKKTIIFSNNQPYSIPTFELSPVVRLGVRLWRKY